MCICETVGISSILLYDKQRGRQPLLASARLPNGTRRIRPGTMDLRVTQSGNLTRITPL